MIIDRTTATETRIDAAKRGAEWAWEEIYTELSRPVAGYLRSRGAVDPEDLTSEVFLHLARDIHRFDGDESGFRSWVFVIAHRRLIDSRRSASRRVKLVDDTDLGLEAPGGDVEQEAFDRLAVTKMHQILDLLSEDQRRVLTLRIVADLTLEETAKAMGKRVSAVKALQRRGLAAVRAHIEKGRVSI